MADRYTARGYATSSIHCHRLIKGYIDKRNGDGGATWPQRGQLRVCILLTEQEGKSITELNINSSSSVNGVPGSHSRSDLDLNNEIAIDELDNIRLREVTGKAVSGSLILLLKWFKRSRVFPWSLESVLSASANILKIS